MICCHGIGGYYRNKVILYDKMFVYRVHEGYIVHNSRSFVYTIHSQKPASLLMENVYLNMAQDMRE